MAIKVLISGASYYNDENLTDLPFSTNDMISIKSSLIKGLKIEPDNIVTIGQSGELMIKDFKTAFISFVSNAEVEDTLIFYYSGHGGKGHICLTDGDFNLQSIIDYLNIIGCKNRIVILDCCYSGFCKISNKEVEQFIDDYERLFSKQGCTILASSRGDEESWTNPDRKMSLYTSFLCDALINPYIVKKGRKSLYDINELVVCYANAWNKHNTNSQHPIFKSTIIGTIFFDVEEYHPYQIEKYYEETEEYIIYSVDSLHTTSSKRYAVKVILRKPSDYNAISLITKEIEKKLKICDIYKNSGMEKVHKGNKTNVIFAYFGYSEEDIAAPNYCYRATWADDVHKKIFYKENKRSKVVDDIWIIEETSYSFIKEMMMPIVDKKELIDITKFYTKQLIINAQAFLALYYKYVNGELLQDDLIDEVEPLTIQINHLYLRVGNLPIAPIELKEWSEAHLLLASCIYDFSIYYNRQNLSKWGESDRKTLMHIAINKYNQQIEKMNDIDLTLS